MDKQLYASFSPYARLAACPVRQDIGHDPRILAEYGIDYTLAVIPCALDS